MNASGGSSMLAIQRKSRFPAKMKNDKTCYGTARSTFSGLRLHALFLEAPNSVRFVHNAALPYHPPFRPFRYHPGADRTPLKPVETASGC